MLYGRQLTQNMWHNTHDITWQTQHREKKDLPFRTTEQLKQKGLSFSTTEQKVNSTLLTLLFLKKLFTVFTLMLNAELILLVDWNRGIVWRLYWCGRVQSPSTNWPLMNSPYAARLWPSDSVCNYRWDVTQLVIIKKLIDIPCYKPEVHNE